MPEKDLRELITEIDSRLEVAIYNAVIGETDVGLDEVVEIARLFKKVTNSLPTGGI